VEPTQRPPTAVLEAYRLYSEARFFLPVHSDSFRKAIDRYQQAIARDPGFALAYSGLADSYAYMAEFSISPPNEVMPKARDAAERAVALDPGLGEAHTSFGLMKLDYEWDRPAAEKKFLTRRRTLIPVGEAIAEMRKAMTYDPLSPPLYWDLASDLVLARKYDDAAAVVDKGLELFPLEQDLLVGRQNATCVTSG
jgi:tetratricopeptide (TPR) repeat protein